MKGLLLTFLLSSLSLVAAPSWFAQTAPQLEKDLQQKHGEAQLPRIRQGLTQVAGLWRESDGDAAAFRDFVLTHFAGDQASRDALFERFQRRLEVLDGHLVELGYEFRLHTDLELGPVLPFDELFAAYSPGAHVSEDFFANKIAFVALLNFPLTTLEQRLNESANWSRRQWADTRLAARFEQRLPAQVLQDIAKADSEADLYINDYKIWAHHLVDAQGVRLFAPGLKLITHWNLRDEIKAQYARKSEGLAAQLTIARVMERIIDQSAPKVVINNPAVDWNPFANTVAPAAVKDSDKAPLASPSAEPEGDERYARLLALFRAQRAADAYSPTAPTCLARRFDLDRQMSEARVQAMLEQVLSAPQFAAVAQRVRDRLGRPLEPFDIWYNGFRPRGAYTEAELDAITRKRFPTAEAYREQIPQILQSLGFRPEKAAHLKTLIEVQPSRGPGHAMGGAMRGQSTRLRTRVEAEGMNYKGFNIAVHEMGHNVEQIYSQNDVDHALLAGVPNTAFTEALAMLLQSHDLEVLGLSAPDEKARSLAMLDLYWQTAEISGVSLVDMGVWHWLYAHPEATPAQLREATLEISRSVWNRFFAPVMGHRDSTLLAIYSHMIFRAIYLPDYAIGHLIQTQVGEAFAKAKNFGDEYERVTSFGNLPPDIWMKNATGAPVGAEALLRLTQQALDQSKK
jgi:hypothetical protein